MGTSEPKLRSGRRSWPRFFLDVEWFVESLGCSTLGRGLEVSLRGARLPVSCASPFMPSVVLYLSLPDRAQLFKAKCSASMRAGRGWLLSFLKVTPPDLELLGQTLIDQFGVLARPPFGPGKRKEIQVLQSFVKDAKATHLLG
jgi:hypothetical protein